DTVANIWTGSDFVGESNCRSSQSAPPFYHDKKKFFATSEFSRKAAGNKNIKTVHDVPLRPVIVLFHHAETRAVRRLHHSAEAICLVLPRLSSHQCDQSSTPSCGDGVLLSNFLGGLGHARYQIQNWGWICNVQDHLPSKLRSLFGVSCHNQSMELEKTAIYIALNFAT
ncbi:hypothetical protein MTR67_010669, partial [Solanum verrucosum]